MPLKVREVVRLLEQHGWVEMRSRGSHRHFKHPEHKFVITVPGEDGKNCPQAPCTLSQIGGPKMKRYRVLIEPTSTGFSAYSPDVPGCVAVGDAEDDTRRNFRDALVEHFGAMREIGAPIPEPHTSVDYVEVAA